MFRSRIGRHRSGQGGLRISRTGTRFVPHQADKTVSHIAQYIESSRLEPVALAEDLTNTHSFQDFDLSDAVMRSLTGCGFHTPTPIQDQVISLVLEGRDIIGLANTGTGKTGAFLLPLITRLERGLLHQVIVLAPTRELALQIQEDFRRFSKETGLASVLCIGGTSVKQQIRSLLEPYQVLIGTPGRVKDMVNQRYISMSAFDAVVLDEVDRMLDMGFIHDVRELLEQLPAHRQSLFFSATLPAAVEKLCHTFGHHPQMISVKTTEYAQSVEQKLVKLPAGQPKLEVLYDMLCNQTEFSKVLIFGRTKHGVRRLAQELDKRGFAVDSIHGDKSQAYRQRSLEKFKRHEISILVATDVAARGIDVADVTHVINYDVPETIEDYIHRIGRTGRAGKIGTAVTFVV